MLIVTNNELVLKKYQADYQIMFIQNGVAEVFKKARDEIHRGYRLINHPLMGSIKPDRTPCRSLLLKSGGKIDRLSLEVIENAIMSYVKFAAQSSDREVSDRAINERVRHDYELIDLELLENVLWHG